MSQDIEELLFIPSHQFKNDKIKTEMFNRYNYHNPRFISKNFKHRDGLQLIEYSNFYGYMLLADNSILKMVSHTKLNDYMEGKDDVAICLEVGK